MTPALLGLGTALPPHRMTRAESEAVTRAAGGPDGRALAALYRQAGVEFRHVSVGPDAVRDILDRTTHSGSPFAPGPAGGPGPTTGQRLRAYAEHAPQLALRAARAALADAGLSPTAVTHLVTASCTGFAAPGVDVALIAGLGLPATTPRTNVGFMGCHGALNALRVAAAFAADPTARVLVAAVELCSLHFHYGSDPQRLVANALFADGAAAAVVGSADAPWALRASGACLFPDSADAMTWTVGDHGFEMTLSPRVPGLIHDHLRPWLESWLGDHGVSLDRVGSWAVHPGGPRVVSGVEAALGLPRGTCDESRRLLADCGNMSSPTVLFLVERLRRSGAARPCVALGFGPGLAAEAALFA